MREALRKPVCSSCPHNLHYSDAVPKRAMGVMLHMGERFCTGGKKPRRFKRVDPKIYVPSWCPKRKSPCELRVYGFKSIRDEWLHSDLCRSIGKPLPPEEHRYALIYEGRTDLSPRDFWERCGIMPDPENGILENPVQKYQVLEIDDGLKPVFFYRTERGFKLHYSFNTEIVRENKLEED